MYAFTFYGGLEMLQEKSRNEIVQIISNHKDDKTPLMMILSDIQKKFGYIPLEVQELVSDRIGIPVAEIYGVVTFYSFFSLTPKGKYIVGVCLGTACYVNGSSEIIDEFAESLGIKVGQTTEDGLFTLDALRCIGACGIGPAVNINGKIYPRVNVKQVPSILKEYRG
jgi:NADH-quinone oxidoreductase subunit E/NADP-reducing hydrogenase subunit HndA